MVCVLQNTNRVIEFSVIHKVGNIGIFELLKMENDSDFCVNLFKFNYEDNGKFKFA